MQITEAHRIEIDTDDGRYQFEVNPDAGRLVLAQVDDRREEVCAITLDDDTEFKAFFEGLRRIFRAHPQLRERAARHPDRPPLEHPPNRNGDDKSRIEKARKRHGNAFQPWSADEERRLAAGHRQGRSVAQLAADHDRSERAIRMRLDRLESG